MLQACIVHLASTFVRFEGALGSSALWALVVTGDLTEGLPAIIYVATLRADVHLAVINLAAAKQTS